MRQDVCHRHCRETVAYQFDFRLLRLLVLLGPPRKTLKLLGRETKLEQHF